MRSSIVAFAVVVAVGLAGLLALGLTRTSDLAYSAGAIPGAPEMRLKHGQRGCQGPYRLPSDSSFDRIAFALGTDGRTGGPVRVLVREVYSRRVIASGRLPGGYPDVTRAPEHVVRVRPVSETAPLDICLVNEGRVPVAVYGQADIASPTTTATLDGRPAGVDLGFELRTEPRSLVSLLPRMAERAARFRAGWVSPVVYAVLGLLLLVGAPLVLGRALGRAAAADQR